MEEKNKYGMSEEELFCICTVDQSDKSDVVYSNQTFFKDAWMQLWKNKVVVVCIILLGLLTLFAILTPLLSPYEYTEVNMPLAKMPPRVPLLEKIGILDEAQDGVNIYDKEGFDGYFLFGTDNLGRDIFVRVAMGTRISLLIALAAVVVDICIGVVYGLITGFFGGWIDIVMQRFVEILYGIPTMVVLTLLLLVLEASLLNIIIALIINGWISMSRIARAQTLKLRETEYVLASRTMGVSSFKILRQDMLPNMLGQIIVTFMFSIPNAIFSEAFLAYIGLGVPAPLASLGTLISDGYKSAMTYPYMVIAPIVTLGLLMLCFNLLADGLRDAVDPKMKTV